MPSALAVKAEDYPLLMPLFLLTSRRRLPLFARQLTSRRRLPQFARQFLDFLATPRAHSTTKDTGSVDRSPERQPMTADGLRHVAQGLGADLIPKVAACGETKPIACDITAPGRHVNRRVELWIKPPVTNSPAP